MSAEWNILLRVESRQAGQATDEFPDASSST